MVTYIKWYKNKDLETLTKSEVTKKNSLKVLKEVDKLIRAEEQFFREELEQTSWRGDGGLMIELQLEKKGIGKVECSDVNIALQALQAYGLILGNSEKTIINGKITPESRLKSIFWPTNKSVQFYIEPVNIDLKRYLSEWVPKLEDRGYEIHKD
jgi:hypothetical protein